MSDTNDDVGQQQPWNGRSVPPGSTVEDLWAKLQEARREAGGYRVGNKGLLAEAALTLAELAGIEVADRKAPPDIRSVAETLQTQHKKLAAENRELKVRASLAEAAQRHGAKLGLTRAYLLDTGVLQRLDPSKDDFEEQIETALEEALEQEPDLRGRGNVPSRAGTEITGGLNQTPAYTRAEIAAMRPEEVVALRRAGKLDHLTGGR